MKSRIKQHAPDLPFYISIDEAHEGGQLYHAYQGAGAALIICAGDTILDLVYIESDKQAAEAWADGILAGCEVYFGMCSCVQFCDPLDLSEVRGNADAIKAMIAHGKENKFMGYV